MSDANEVMWAEGLTEEGERRKFWHALRRGQTPLCGTSTFLALDATAFDPLGHRCKNCLRVLQADSTQRRQVWCVGWVEEIDLHAPQAREVQWCATKNNKRFDDTEDSVETLCDHHIILPVGMAKRRPTCGTCLTNLEATNRQSGQGPDPDQQR